MSKQVEKARARGGRRWLAVATAGALAAVIPTSDAGAGSVGATERVSVSTSGGQSTGGGGIPAPSLSDDGRFVTWHSRADGIVANDTNDREDVFVHDRDTDVTSRVSVTGAGAQANGPSLFPEISGNGQVVAFSSGATNLVPGDTNASPQSPTASPEATGRDAFVYDRRTGAVERLDVGPGGVEGRCFTGNPPVFAPCGGVVLQETDINFDGNLVVYAANASNLIVGDTNGGSDVFLRDRQAGTTTRMSVITGGAQAGGGSAEPAIAGEGRFVSYSSTATNLVAGDTNNSRDVFVFDRQTTTTTRVSLATGGAQANNTSNLPSISDDGRFVAFTSIATNLVPGDTNNAPDIFLHDRQTSTTTRVSVGPGGAQSPLNLGSFFPAISGDGRYVAFDSLATTLVTGDTNSVSDTFVHDRQTSTTSRVSLTRFGAEANGGSYFAALNRDGRFAAFASDATNLVSGDTNLAPDVFVHDRTLPTPSTGGYRFVASDGGVFAFGDAGFFGSAGNIRLNRPVVGMASTPKGKGYWLAATDGGIFSYGDAGFFGSTGGTTLARPIVGIAGSPSGAGYWLVASDGGVFAFGDAKFFGSTGAMRLTQPIVGMAATPSGAGYFLVAADGGIFAFGDAVFKGSTGATRLTRPIVGMAVTPSGGGYWLTASDGGVFAFGDAAFLGSAGGSPINQPVVAVLGNASGKGYWLVARDGGVFAYGDSAFLGSTGAQRLNQPIVGGAGA